MKILDAFREMAAFYPYDTIVKTEGGHYRTLADAWGEEMQAIDNGHEDPNEYGVNAETSVYFEPRYPAGIYFKTNQMKFGGMAYEIKETP